jgi:hypothetical protein
MRFLIIPFILFPTFLAYSISYAVKNPDELSGPLFVGLVSLLITIYTQKKGLKYEKTIKDQEFKLLFKGARIGGLFGGPVIMSVLHFVLGNY